MSPSTWFVHVIFVAEQVQPFILTVQPAVFSRGFFFSSKIMCHCLTMVIQEITLLQWSAQSPDHSLIKHLWDEGWG